MSKIWSFLKLTLWLLLRPLVWLGQLFLWVADTVALLVENLVEYAAKAWELTLMVFAAVIIWVMIIFGCLYVNRYKGMQNDKPFEEWLQLFSVIPLYVNRQWIFFEKFWVTISETDTGKEAILSKIHPQQVPVPQNVYRVHLEFHTKRDRMMAKLRRI